LIRDADFLVLAVDQVGVSPILGLMQRTVAQQVDEIRGTKKRSGQMVEMHGFTVLTCKRTVKFGACGLSLSIQSVAETERRTLVIRESPGIWTGSATSPACYAPGSQAECVVAITMPDNSARPVIAL
jgi:hypothetical protein